MKNSVYIFFFMLSLLAGLCNCSDPPQRVEAATEIKQPPQKDTLDQLAENFIQNADSDTIDLQETPTAKEESTNPEQKADEEVPVKKLEKAEKKVIKEKKKRSRKKPKIVFENESFSFGRIMQGEEKEFKFKFKNAGNASLQIIDVKVTCGCTVPSYPFIPIEPGEEGFIGVTYNSTGKLGPQKPAITVITNASPKTYKLNLEGIVDAERED